MRSSNPALSVKAFENLTLDTAEQNVMTWNGAVNKTAILFVLALGAAAYAWANPVVAAPLVTVGFIGGFILAIITSFKKEWAPVTTPLYALLQGVALGGLSRMFETMYEGIVMNALALTFGTLFMMLTLYKTGIINPTEKFRAGVVGATGAIALAYLVSIVLGFFGIRTGIFTGNSMFSIGISLVIVAVAALNLVLDFDFIEKASAKGFPKYMEWYAAFGLMVTLVWLYLEILRLLSKLRSRN